MRILLFIGPFLAFCRLLTDFLKTILAKDGLTVMALFDVEWNALAHFTLDHLAKVFDCGLTKLRLSWVEVALFAVQNFSSQLLLTNEEA